MKSYNGHRSWNAWNVCLWLHNDPDWYSEWEWMPEYPEISLESAVKRILNALPKKTPDGAVFNPLSIKLAIEENWSK